MKDRAARRPNQSNPQSVVPDEAEQQPIPTLRRLQRSLGNRKLARLLNGETAIGKQGGVVAPEISAAINQRRGRGNPLGTATRNRMEQQFATSFDDVSVHADTTANQLAQQVGARAFTTGSDIFLGRDAAATDQQLLAHELTHVVQQRNLSVGGPMRVTAHNDATELEAERNARRS